MIRLLLTGLLCIICLTPSAWSVTLKRESKAECAICHVLWFDSLAKGKKTLLPRTDSPIVIAGSTGLATSPEMCYSCHEGYVADSRNVIVRDNKHQLIGKVPKRLKLPEIFRLTKDDEFYCGTCHGFHDIRALGEVGNTPFTRMRNDRSQMCIACHEDKLESKPFPNHPVMVSPQSLSISAIHKKGPDFGPENEMICQSCHNAHGRRALIASVEDSAICLICHEDNARLFGTKHDLSVTMPDEKNMKNQSLSVSGPCGGCHIPHSPFGPKLWARELQGDGSLSMLCLSCHQEKTTDLKIKGTGQYSHPVNVRQESKEFTSISGIHLPLYSIEGKAQETGMVQCSSCHNPHQWDPESPERRGGKETEGNTSNSFLRMPCSGASSLCMVCHGDKKQLLSYDHNLNITAPEDKNMQGVEAEVSGSCGACHVPHHAAGPKLWARELSPDQPLVSQYCLNCHSKSGSAGEKTVGKEDHPIDTVSEGFHIADAVQVSVELPLFSTEGTAEPGKTIRCLTCHDPHIWTANQMSPSTGFDVAEGNETGQSPLEGDARSSFLRKPASPGPDLCIICHEDTVLLEGTDHDLFVTAPEARNLMGQTVKEAGQCGVCHAVHNSPHALKLWARSYGPVAENQHPMNALCTSCHSENQVAKNKVPPIATHPAGWLITNIARFTGQRKGYTPLFSHTGKEVSVGDLSCSSCHSFFAWDPDKDEKGPQINAEGDASNSFLRTSLDQTVCSDCHGEEAIWRYTYFHSIPKREMLKAGQPLP